MWKALKNGHSVYPIYITIENNDNKVLVEKQQCELIINELKKEFNVQLKLETIAKIKIDDSSNFSFPQPLL